MRADAMTDINHYEQSDHYVDAPARTERLVDSAMRNVAASREAHAVLRVIDAGTGRPDELSNRLLEMLAGLDDAHRADVIKGFLRPVEKALERTRAAE